MVKIFEPFFSTKPKGTGLGLAVSYAIVKNHGGDIQAFSKPGEGSRFVLEFPILETEPQPGKARTT
jgi:two-component system sensor histidine kinase FlrB